MTPNASDTQPSLVPLAAPSGPQPRRGSLISRLFSPQSFSLQSFSLQPFSLRPRSRIRDEESAPSSAVNASTSSSNTIPSSPSQTNGPSTTLTSQSSIPSPGRVSLINLPKPSLPGDLHMLDTVRYRDLNNDWPKVHSRLSGELNKTPWRGKVPWVIELFMKGESEIDARPAIVITLFSSSKDTERKTREHTEKKIKDHCSGLTWLQDFMKVHGLALHIEHKEGQIRLCAAHQLGLGKTVLTQHQCEIVLPKDASMQYGYILHVQTSSKSSAKTCSLGGFITVGSTLYGLTVKHGIEAGMNDTSEKEDDDDDVNKDEAYGQKKPVNIRHNACKEDIQHCKCQQGNTSYRELGPGGAQFHHRSASCGTSTAAGRSPVTAPTEICKERVPVNALFIPSSLSNNPSTDIKNPQFDYDWALLDLSELSAEELGSILAVGTPHGMPIHGVCPERVEAQGRVCLSGDGTSPLSGYLSSTPSSLDFGESLYDVRLITLEDTLPVGSSGAWVTLDNLLCGYVVAAREDVPWAYMIPIHPAFDQIRAIYDADIRIPSVEELMGFHRGINPTQSGLRHLRAPSNYNPNEMTSTFRTSRESTFRAAGGQATNDFAPPEALCRQCQDTRRREEHTDHQVHASEEKSWRGRWIHRRKILTFSSKSESSRSINADDVEHNSLNLSSDDTWQTRLKSVSSLFHILRPLKSLTAPVKFGGAQCSALSTHLAPGPIPNMVSCKLIVAYNGTHIDKDQSFRYRWLTDKHSYQELTQMAEQILLNSRKLGIGKLYLESGICRLWKDDPHEEYESRLVENESDWSSAIPLLIAGFCSKNPYANFHLELHLNYSSIPAVLRIKHKDFPETLKAVTESHKLFNFENKAFFPCRALSKIFSRYTIMALVNHFSVRPPQIARSCKTICKKQLIDHLVTRAYRLTALCVYVGIPFHQLCQMVMLDIDDASLLLKQENVASEELQRMFRELLPHQWSFFALDFQSGNYRKVLRVIDSRVVVPIKFDESRDRLGVGQFGAVYKVKIGRDYHDFSANKDQYFALKRFHVKHVQHPGSFELESHALRALAETAHSHLVPHLASWTQNEHFFMLFPYAGSNLHALFRTEPTPNLTKDKTLWLLRQLNGLADAVRHIHNLGPSGLGRPSSGFDSSVASVGWLMCVHMDIKPENILVFSDKHHADGVWKIADFGLSSVMREIDGSGKITPIRSSYLTGSHDFEPPEYFLESKVSEKFDIWSLGCIFTEVLVWILGQSTMEDFDKARMDSKYQEQERGTMFWHRTDPSNANLNPAVDEELKSLQAFCVGRGVFEGLVRLTRKLLTIEPDRRPPAAIVCNGLDVYLRQGELDLRDDEFYLHDLRPGWQLLAPPSESPLTSVSTMAEATTINEDHLAGLCNDAQETGPYSPSQRGRLDLQRNSSSVARTKKPQPRSTLEVIPSAHDHANYNEKGAEELGTMSDVPALATDLGDEKPLKLQSSIRVQSLLLGAHQFPVEYKDILPSYQLKRGWESRTL